MKACGHYTNSVRAVQEAIRRGYDEAVLLNHKGEVAEGSGANLFMVRNGTLITNDLEASILPGIKRDSVQTIARDAGVDVIRYESVRDPEHAACVAILRPSAFARPSPRQQQTWFLAAARTHVRCVRDGDGWEFTRAHLLAV